MSTERETLTEEEKRNAVRFQGYGNKEGKYWFLGMEEGGGSLEELKERAALFSEVEDLYEAHDKLGRAHTMERHVPTWRVMSKLIMALNGEPDWAEPQEARRYQADKLGRKDGETFLVELMPLPSPSTHEWPYESIYPDRDTYYQAVRPGRIAMLREELSKCSPEILICYGKGNWRHHEEIFEEIDFTPALDNKIKVGLRCRTTILLLPFLSYDLVTRELTERIGREFGALLEGD